MDYESGRNNLVELNKWYKRNSPINLNEADTRFHIIDELFFKCLGWEKDDCKHEEPQESEYADYTFYSSGARVLIVEAKRSNIGFELAAGTRKKTEYKISSIIRDSNTIGEAVHQVFGYCNRRGVEFAVVANGYQIIAFLSHRSDGTDPLQGRAVVFDSIDSMEENFLFLWQMLSKPGILERRLSQYLRESETPILPLKLSTRIDNYPKVARRNELQIDLQLVSEVILENVNKNEEISESFLKETYCSSGALSQYALVSRAILTNRYSLLFDEATTGPIVKDAVNKKGISPDLFGQSLTSAPILLLGDVGSGKSMFINYFIKIEANEIIKKSFTIYVDLGSKAALALNLRIFFLDELIRLFQEKYQIDFYEKNFVRGVYDLELIRFSKGIYGDLKIVDPSSYLNKELQFLEEKLSSKENHIKNCLEHISKGWKRQIILFMDNVDQREEHVQEQAFLIANEIAVHWPVVVFLTLRPSTYYKSKKEGALTGYHPKAFTISPPRADEVITKRLNFAIKIAKGEVETKTLSGVFSVKLEKLTQFLEILVVSFQVNRDLYEFVDNICYGNIRRAIEYLTTFIGSGHIDTKKILEYDSESLPQGKRYIVSLHEFIRAIIFKEHQYFYPDSTEIFNLLDVYSEAREHFLLPILLDYLLRNSTTHRNDGFINSQIIVEFLQDEGFAFSQIEYAILRTIYKGLIETEARRSGKEGEKLPMAIRITSIGAYHLQKLLGTFVYIDAIVVDVPIFIEDKRDEIKDGFSITDRLKRALVFCSYLDIIWYSCHFRKTGLAWNDISHKIRQNVEAIQHRLAQG